MRPATLATFLATAVVAACGGDSGAEDARADGADSALPRCEAQEDCDDGVFCNGVERCAPESGDADAFGCVGAGSPCLEAQSCNEESDHCDAICGVASDADGDGHDALACDGDDCDDADPNRFPTNSEVCDAMHHDEDCDATTFGLRDSDGDTYPDATCCNVQGSESFCGTDCDDGHPDVHPTQAEVCNGIDDNCDGVADEGLAIVGFFPDCDGDDYGAIGRPPLMRCGAPTLPPSCPAPGPGPMNGWADNADDCNDGLSDVNPGTSEDTCNGLDDNCDGLLHPTEDADRDGAASVACGGADCDDEDDATYPGAPESCDRRDNDCSLTGAMAGGLDPAEDVDDDGHAPTGASCSGGPLPLDDCDDSRPDIYPGAPELCDGVDTDCDGIADDEPAATASCELDGHTSWTCRAGGCAVLSCPPGWDDCGGGDADGCETDLGRAPHCGSCAGSGCLLACGSPGCDEAVEIVAGSEHTCARRASGQVACWGSAMYGQLGAETWSSSSRPVAVVGLADAVELTSGLDHTCARRLSGEVACWGRGGFGRLGDGGGLERWSPVSVVGVVDAVEVDGGGGHTCARRAGGRVSCWGLNWQGQLGDGTTVNPTMPVSVAGVTDAVEVAAGTSHTCARRATGQIVCWGDNTYGQLGDGTTTPRLTPVAVLGLTASEIAAGSSHTCARSGGQVVCWGAGGLLGDGATTRSSAPVGVVGISDAVEITSRWSHTCARRATGQVVCWGDGAAGQLGDGTTASRTAPVAVTGIVAAAEIIAGRDHTCARDASSQVMCWGRNDAGQLGDASTSGRTVPVPLAPL